MDPYGLRDHVENVFSTSIVVDLLKNHEEAVAHGKHFIMDGVKDHIVPHIAKKKTTHETWKALTTLYDGKSV